MLSESGCFIRRLQGLLYKVAKRHGNENRVYVCVPKAIKVVSAVHKKGDDNETVSKIFWRAFSKCNAI